MVKIAKSSGKNMRISVKHSVEIGKTLRGKKLASAMKILNNVIEKKQAIKFRRYNKDTGHKKGMAAGRYPVNAAKEIYILLNNALANAINQEMDPEKIYIKTFITSRAVSKEQAANRRIGKLTHIDITVAQKEEVKKNDRKKAN